MVPSSSLSVTGGQAAASFPSARGPVSLVIVLPRTSSGFGGGGRSAGLEQSAPGGGSRFGFLFSPALPMVRAGGASAMRRGLWIAGLLAALAGCADTAQERARDYNEVGVRFNQGGNYRAAADSFQAALALTPEDAALLYNLGQCYDRLAAPAGAEKK